MEKNKDHIIGGYVRGNISAEDRAWLEQAMQEDAALAAKVQALQLDYIIERYLAGEMSEAERTAFASQIATNTELQEKVQMEKAAQQFLQQARRMELHKALDKAAQKSQERKARQQPFKKGLLFTILLITVAFIIRWIAFPSKKEHGLQLQNQSSKNDTMRLNQSTNDTMVRDTPSSVIPMKPKPDTAEFKNKYLIIAMLDEYDRKRFDLPAIRNDAIVNDWQIDYQNNDYDMVINKINPLINKDLSDNDTARLVLALALYYHTIPDYNKAIAQFDVLIKANSIFLEEARWFKAVALLRQNKPQEAIIILQTIVQEKGAAFNKRKASELLAQLRRN